MQENTHPKLILRTKTDHGDKTVVAALRSDTENKAPDMVQGVFGDCEYSIAFEDVDFDGVQNIHIYVNGNFEWSYFDGTTVSFPQNNDGFLRKNRKIFADLYGYADIEVRLIKAVGETAYHTGYIPVLVRRTREAESVRKMVSYISEHAQELLGADKGAVDSAGFHDGGKKTLLTQIRLAETVAETYEKLYGYFVTNSRYATRQTLKVDDIEKLRQITVPTLQYMACHPEYLQKTYRKGIKVGTDTYIPKKTLVSSETITMDIYENEMMVSFLLTVLKSLGELERKVSGFAVGEAGEDADETASEYVRSSVFILGELGASMEKSKNMIEKLIRRYEILYHNYSDIYGVQGNRLDYVPKQTPIYESIPQYNMVYNCMCRWFRFGLYDFSGEELLLTFQRISVLYETYTLARMITAVSGDGYELQSASRHKYDASATKYYRNTLCKNTYVYRQGDREITVYYQPLITTDPEKRENGIALYRNTSMSLIGGERTGSSYTPDFIVKLKDNTGSHYKIYDSKYSSEKTVLNYDINDCILKYLFSVSTAERGESVDGLYILYGKTAENTEKNLHDCEPEGNPVYPETRLIPLSEMDSVTGKQTGNAEFLRTIRG